jgi:hypothetical protein
MIKLSVGLILTTIVLLTNTSGSPSTELIPIIPPAAVVGQPYIFQFSVVGMKYPRYEFQGLPGNISGNEKGFIQGVASRVGSYPIIISYTEKGCRQ